MAKGGGGKITPTYISCSKPHRNEIPAATPLFSTTPDSPVPLPTLSDAWIIRNSRWRTVNRKNTGSLEWNEIFAKSQWQTPHFPVTPTTLRQHRHCPTRSDIGGQPEVKITSGFRRHFEIRMSISGSVGSATFEFGMVQNMG